MRAGSAIFPPKNSVTSRAFWPSCTNRQQGTFNLLLQPRTSAVVLPLLLTLLRSFVAVLDVKILVPGKSGLKVFLMKMGTPAETAGCMVLGWMTLAPK